MKIISGSSNKPLAKKIANKIGINLVPLEIFVFPDGERRVRVEERVVGETLVIVQSTSTPVDQNYMELFFLADAAKRGGAEFTVAVIPYFGYQRQDHLFREGEAVSLEVVIKMIENIGINRLISFDLHSIKIPEIFTIPVTHLSALPIFADEIIKRGWQTRDTVLVSPDTGGVRRIRMLSELLNNLPYVAVEKNRDLATGKVKAVSFKGKLAKRALIVDDMISSGNTMVKAAELLLKNGVEEVYIFATHPVFSIESPKLLQESSATEVIVTDSVFIPLEKQFPKLTVLSIANEVAKELTKSK